MSELYFSTVFASLVQSGELIPKPDLLPPSVPMDFDWARVNILRKRRFSRY